jgi:hypothetical protein
MRERLARAMEYERPDGPCCDGSPHLPVADRILAALGPDVFLVDVETVARRWAEAPDGDVRITPWESMSERDREWWREEARRILGGRE